MGCVSSNLFNRDDDFSQLGSAAFSHHIVSLTSSTYGLTLDPPPTSSTPTTPLTPPSRFTFGSIFPISLSEPRSLWSNSKPLWSEPEVINSWELMDGLDTDSFRFSPLPAADSLFRRASKISFSRKSDSGRFPSLPVRKWESLPSRRFRAS